MSSLSGFAELLDGLSYASGRNAKLKLIADWLVATPDPDRGWGMAALTGGLDLPGVKPAMIRALIEERVDPLLFLLSYDYVGDLAETVSLLWEPRLIREVPGSGGEAPGLDDVVVLLAGLSRSEAPTVLAGLLDRLDASGRYTLLKLATGNLRVGAGARLARMGFAKAFSVSVDDVEELWHGIAPPYAELFAWGEGLGEKPDLSSRPLFRPFMLAYPLEAPEALDVTAYSAEWKWDGIRAMAVRVNGQARLYSRDGNEISRTFPDVAGALSIDAVLDGELLVRGEGAVGSFNALQQRLGRKTVSAAMLAQYPVFMRCYDLLFHGSEDVRHLPLVDRRARLAEVVAGLDAARFDLSPDLEAGSLEALAELRGSPPDPAIEGLMLKRRDSPYVAGRRTGLWYKWKRDAMTADCVLMYAQRGHGKRSSFYSDFTFGAWGADGALLPVGKAYFGFTDAELKWLDHWVRAHTTNRFGPVREVERALVLEVAFDSIGASTRHKSGLAMRFPRISRIRTDKPVDEADTVEGLRRLAG